MQLRFYDTNILMESDDSFFKNEFAVAAQTVIELEEIKTASYKDEETKYKARRATRRLLLPYCTVVLDWDGIRDILAEEELAETSDNLILGSAKYFEEQCGNPVSFYTKDILCYKTAFMLGLQAFFVQDTQDYYCGSIDVSLDDVAMQDFYTRFNFNHFDMLIGQYAAIHDEEGNRVDIVRWNGETHESVVQSALKSRMFGSVTPFKDDDRQIMAIDSLLRNRITMLSGKAASGKTYLALAYMYHLLDKKMIDKIVVFANTVPVKNTATIGFLPGTREEKLMESSIGNILSSKLGGKEGLLGELERRRIEIYPACDIRGFDTSGMRAGVLVTEAQNADVELLKLMLQRIGEDSYCVIEGDYDTQVDNGAYAGDRNGMRRLSQVFRGDPSYGEVKLNKIHRSHIAELADRM